MTERESLEKMRGVCEDLDIVRECLGVREWAASITPSTYGEKVEAEMPVGFASLDRLAKTLATYQNALSGTQQVRDEYKAKADELARTIDAMEHWALMFIDAYQPCECNPVYGSICLAHRIVELARFAGGKT